MKSFRKDSQPKIRVSLKANKLYQFLEHSAAAFIDYAKNSDLHLEYKKKVSPKGYSYFIFHFDKKASQAVAEYLENFSLKLVDAHVTIPDEIECIFSDRSSCGHITLMAKCSQYGFLWKAHVYFDIFSHSSMLKITQEDTLTFFCEDAPMPRISIEDNQFFDQESWQSLARVTHLFKKYREHTIKEHENYWTHYLERIKSSDDLGVEFNIVLDDLDRCLHSPLSPKALRKQASSIRTMVDYMASPATVVGMGTPVLEKMSASEAQEDVLQIVPSPFKPLRSISSINFFAEEQINRYLAFISKIKQSDFILTDTEDLDDLIEQYKEIHLETQEIQNQKNLEIALLDCIARSLIQQPGTDFIDRHEILESAVPDFLIQILEHQLVQRLSFFKKVVLLQDIKLSKSLGQNIFETYPSLQDTWSIVLDCLIFFQFGLENNDAATLQHIKDIFKSLYLEERLEILGHFLLDDSSIFLAPADQDFFKKTYHSLLSYAVIAFHKIQTFRKKNFSCDLDKIEILRAYVSKKIIVIKPFQPEESNINRLLGDDKLFFICWQNLEDAFLNLLAYKEALPQAVIRRMVVSQNSYQPVQKIFSDLTALFQNKSLREELNFALKKIEDYYQAFLCIIDTQPIVVVNPIFFQTSPELQDRAFILSRQLYDKFEDYLEQAILILLPQWILYVFFLQELPLEHKDTITKICDMTKWSEIQKIDDYVKNYYRSKRSLLSFFEYLVEMIEDQQFSFNDIDSTLEIASLAEDYDKRPIGELFKKCSEISKKTTPMEFFSLFSNDILKKSPYAEICQNSSKFQKELEPKSKAGMGCPAPLILSQAEPTSPPEEKINYFLSK